MLTHKALHRPHWPLTPLYLYPRFVFCHVQPFDAAPGDQVQKWQDRAFTITSYSLLSNIQTIPRFISFTTFVKPLLPCLWGKIEVSSANQAEKILLITVVISVIIPLQVGTASLWWAHVRIYSHHVVVKTASCLLLLPTTINSIQFI